MCSSRSTQSLDWPLSRKEKETRLVHLFQSEIASHEEDNRTLKYKLAKERRRSSLPAYSPLKRERCRASEESTPGQSPQLGLTPIVSSPSSSAKASPAPAAATKSPPVLIEAPSDLEKSLALAADDEARLDLWLHGTEASSEDPEQEPSTPAQPEPEPSAESVQEAPVLKPVPRKDAPPEELKDLSPLSTHQCELRDALVQFYKERHINGEQQATKLARMCGHSGDKIDETQLWAAISQKYGSMPIQAVVYLARTLHAFSLVQWPKDNMPIDARLALDRITAEARSGGTGSHHRHLLEVKDALNAEDSDLLKALTFRGCPEQQLRPEVWRTLLRARKPVEKGKQGPKREQYHKLRQRAMAPASRAADALEHPSMDFATVTSREISEDMKNAWKGEAFLSRPGVADAVKAIAFTTACRYGCHVRGSCEMAALLLYVMAADSEGDDLGDAEADAYWCLSHLMLDMQNSIVDEQNQVKQTHHILQLLRLYDQPLAELLKGAGIISLPTIRLGIALLTRAGFSLEACSQLWDAILADPKRFEFCNYTIIAVLLLNREQLLKKRHDASLLAEEVLASPRRADIASVLSTAYAICAFERRCDDSCPAPFPPRPGVLDVVIPTALEAAANVTDKVRANMVGFWRATKKTAQKVAESAKAAHAAQQTGVEGLCVARPLKAKDNGAETAMNAVLEVGMF